MRYSRKFCFFCDSDNCVSRLATLELSSSIAFSSCGTGDSFFLFPQSFDDTIVVDFMEYVADLHLHSKYSRAVSQDMILPIMAAWAKKKGIDILTVSDWTHPIWFREIQTQLEEAGEGVYKLKTQIAVSQKEPLFLLTVEVSSIYNQGGRLRRIHNLIFAPNFAIAGKISKELARRGANLMSDGRPIIGLSAKNLLELVLGVDKRAMLIPCHIWTPWFSLYGANSGFDSIEECFGDYGKYIFAIETGLSSDPAMNWKIAELANRSILSFSDAHSPAKMGREATVFDLPEISYQNIRRAIISPSLKAMGKFTFTKVTGDESPKEAPSKVAYTMEFYPEEGKYHYTGHRNCKVVQSPAETAQKGTQCPVCGRTLTVGVEHRVQQLAKGEISNFKFKISNDQFGTQWVKDPNDKRPPYVSLVPLLEIIAEAQDSTTASQKVKDLYDQFTKSLGSETDILLRTTISDIGKKAGSRVAEGIKKVRERQIVVTAGYDGVYGVVKIWNQESGDGQVLAGAQVKTEDTQLGLF